MLATIAFILQLAALIIMAVYLFRPGSRDSVSAYILLASALLLLAELVIRSFQIGFAAITNTYESLVFFSAVIMIILGAGKLKFRKSFGTIIVFGGTVVSLALLAIASSPIAPDTVKPPIPALQSYWLVLHVTFAFIGEAFFAVAFVSAIVYLATRNTEKRKRLDKTIYRHRHRLSHIHSRRPDFRCRLGRKRLGTILVLGSQGNMGTDYLAHIYALSACQIL